MPGTVQLTADIDSVLQLPEGASYVRDQDGIRATLRRRGNSLEIEAAANTRLITETCTNRAEGLHEDAIEEEVQSCSNGVETRFKWLGAGVLLALMAVWWLRRR